MKEPVQAKNGKTLVDRRHCIVDKGFVTPSDGCEKLILADIIWCKKHTQWIHRVVCIKKYINKEDACKRCSQAKELISITRRVGTKKRKKRLLIRKK